MMWHLSNTYHELEQLRYNMVLPEGVVWAGESQAEAGTITYDSKTRTVRWELNWLPLAVRDITTWFDVTITPTEGQHGTFPTLIEQSSFIARDKAIGKDFSIVMSEQTTAVPLDDLAKDKGKVQ